MTRRKRQEKHFTLQRSTCLSVFLAISRRSVTMSMQAYLAEKYMTGPKADAILARVAPKKKKKRKAESSSMATSSGSAMIVDTDGGWGDEGKDEGGDDLADA